MATPDIANLAGCIEDARRAWIDTDAGPKDPTNYSQLMDRLEAAKETLPPLYRKTVYDPYLRTLKELGASDFKGLLASDPDLEGEAGIMIDIAHAILQNGEGYLQKATDALQEVISDLYDGFLSAEDRRGVKPPDEEVIPPLVKWGSPSSGPYTWPSDAVSVFGLEAAVVSVPPAHARLGLMGWAALGHETTGHDILHADTGLLQEMQRDVRTALQKARLPGNLPGYWASRIDETASDVMGILNIGPAAGIGVVGYFRGINAALSGRPQLDNTGAGNDPHPADILRGYLASAAVRLLSFDGAKAWAELLLKETEKDVSKIRLSGVEVAKATAKRSAEIVAETLATKKFLSLESHALLEIQDWSDRDERIARRLAKVLNSGESLPRWYRRGAYAAHVVAAAVLAGLERGANLAVLFDRMLTVLKAMHDKNPSWGPLFVAHPGMLAKHKLITKGGEEDFEGEE